MKQVLIIGGAGRIGRNVAMDLLQYQQIGLTITSTTAQTGSAIALDLGPQVQFQVLDLADRKAVEAAIAPQDLVIHCAGPFQDRNTQVLELCIQHQVNYLDVSDHPSFTEQARQWHDQAVAAGVTAIVNTGIFPGISNSMVRQDVETLDQPQNIHLSYVVAGTGGAGITIMRTTFLGLQHPFHAWLEGRWQQVQPYSECETIPFPPPYGPVKVFWFDVPERLTLTQSFAVQSVVTKFGSVPAIYNGLTWALAHWLPKTWLRERRVIEFLAWAGFVTTQFTNRWSGTGVAIRSQVTGLRAGRSAQASSSLVLPDTAIAAGYGTGSIAQLILSQRLKQPGVWPVEAALPTPLFQEMMALREVVIKQNIVAT
ncbi:MAG: NAD(P)H-binding protein [Acaryochloridaceae cyanobacterium SU_2_1]|nr:NAD(P)H-binding protein [Acaryochloridaceae cyanobacterium SU_2_1]